MEKQRISRTTRFISRLLTSFFLLVLFTPSLFSSNYLSRSEIDQLRFEAIQNQDFYTNTDIQFEIKIPKVSPKEVQVLRSEDSGMDGFKSMKKFENFSEGGTKIQIWYSFEKTGSHTLPPLKVMIQNRKSYLKFNPVTVIEDPAKKMPQIVIIFSNGKRISSTDLLTDKPVFEAKVGEKLDFTIYLQYIAQLVQFNYDIPKDSIYSQTRTYEITEVKYREKSVSNELIPVADFQWTGLTEGYHTIPKFKLSVISYGGYRTDVMLPEFKINFIPKVTTKTEKKNDNLFEDAFSEPFIESTMPKKIIISNKDCEKLADLYKKERNSLFSYFEAKKERISFEESLGLPSAKNTSPIGLLYLSIILIVLFLIMMIFAIKKRSLIKVFVLATLLFSSSVLLIYTIQKRSLRFGISKGSTVYSIPESTAEASSEITRGNIVKITENTDNWYHIQLGDTSGWCKKENIIFIN